VYLNQKNYGKYDDEVVLNDDLVFFQPVLHYGEYRHWDSTSMHKAVKEVEQGMPVRIW
jgi:hypothetical protein